MRSPEGSCDITFGRQTLAWKWQAQQERALPGLQGRLCEVVKRASCPQRAVDTVPSFGVRNWGELRSRAFAHSIDENDQNSCVLYKVPLFLSGLQTMLCSFSGCAGVYPKYKSMKTIVSNDTILGLFFLSQFGFLGNTLLHVLYINTFLFQPHTKKPIDLIFIHLTLAHVMTILLSEIPEIINSFHIRNFLDDIACKAVLYMYRVSRGLSLCTTFFLSVFQAMIITPSNSRWAWLKPKISKYIFPAFFFWITDMLIYIQVVITIVAPYNTTEVEQVFSDIL
ncbi:hypothetical protein HPG69_018468 [Diceros bicornis minor]|uniref:Vomeronasal type-1 receptor n=1 Tax=Diceros bicornis minor TaxID=77932 RepID=A0A7J7EQY8_DICBM|nr:hypothetical protein HPG69_018468 [Diceros bicornis minor]